MPDKYQMSISLNILNHLGLNLYSNTPTVLAEVIANAWDADATEVRIDFDIKNQTITVTDNGSGMNRNDINDKFLYVGYKKRDNPDYGTPNGRKPMGRKGIGKLSLFAIANKFFVYSLKSGGEEEAFLMDANKIKEAIKGESPSSPKQYEPDPVPFDEDITTHGTIIKITELKKAKITQASINGLKKRIARSFNIHNDPSGFCIFVNDKEITIDDRDYFHKARFLFQYGDRDYAQYCNGLDEDHNSQEKMCFQRPCAFNQDGVAEEHGEYKISGWIAIARRSNDLDNMGPEDENLNKIMILVREKVAQDDILLEYRLGGMFTKYIYGAISAEFLDEDDKDDIATSSRQKISENDPRYKALKSFIERELRYIWIETNKLKEKRGIEDAMSSNPYVKEWYEKLKPRSLQEIAKKIFGAIDKAGIDESEKNNFYANGVLTLEAFKMRDALKMLESIDESNLDIFLQYLSDVDAIEAIHYREIIQERLDVIREFQKHVDNKETWEKVLQNYIFDHLWLLDPAWERATQYKNMEERLQKVVAGVPVDNKTVRLDIRYRRIAASHVIIELKRASRMLSKTEIESQVRKYIAALKKELSENQNEIKYPIESFCIVGRLPQGWDNPEIRKKDEESLRPYSIRVITYQELIDNAYSAYSKYLQASEKTGDLRELIDNIRKHETQ